MLNCREGVLCKWRTDDDKCKLLGDVGYSYEEFSKTCPLGAEKELHMGEAIATGHFYTMWRKRT